MKNISLKWFLVAESFFLISLLVYAACNCPQVVSILEYRECRPIPNQSSGVDCIRREYYPPLLKCDEFDKTSCWECIVDFHPSIIAVDHYAWSDTDCEACYKNALLVNSFDAWHRQAYNDDTICDGNDY